MRRLSGAVFAAVVAFVSAAACTASVSVAGKPATTPARVTSAPASVTPNPGHVRVLTAALQNMTANYAALSLAIPGPTDVLDYNLGALWTKGLDGSGTTIALLEGWDDPNIDSVIHVYDTRLGLPDPQIQTIYPTGGGHLPATCPPGMVALGSYGSCDAWAGELELDVESVHLVAPYAKILLVVTPADSEITDDAASQVAPPEMMAGVAYVATHHLADAMSISDGTGESTYTYGTPELTAQDPGELAAAAAGIPVAVGTGDCGVVQNLAVASSQCGDTTPGPSTAAWDDSPWITAVGGSTPSYSATGARLGPDVVWSHGLYAEGAGVSSVYAKPSYQDAVVTGAKRQVPDLVMDARHGTSQATPLVAAVLDLAAQLNGGPIGPVNDALYRILGPHGAADGITDVVSGSNSTTRHPGFSAGPGFDEATGWGTLDAAAFVPALVAAVRAQGAAGLDSPGPSAQAAAELAKLEHGARLTAADMLTASGFLPKHPVTVAVDGRTLTTLTADTSGTVASTLDLASVRAGRHTLTLTGMLLTQQVTFTQP